MAVDQTGAYFDRILPGIERAVAVVDFRVRLFIEFIGGEVDGCSKSSGSIGRGADASLALDAVNGGGKVGEVDEKEGLLFCVVIGDAVVGDIDAGVIRPPLIFSHYSPPFTYI